MDTRSDHTGTLEVRLRELLESARADGSAPLADILQAAARSTAEILACRHVAISVGGPTGSAEYFTSSPPADGDDDLRLPPSRRGLLAAVAVDGQSVRLADVRADPSGSTDGPPRRGLLGVPIMLRGHPGGGLYLTDPLGRSEFSAEDENVAGLVAATVAAVIERDRTAATNKRRDRWTSGASTLARELVSAAQPRPFRLLARRVLDIADADLVLVLRPHDDGTDRFVVAAGAGEDATVWKHAVLARDALGAAPRGDPGAVQVDGLTQRVNDLDVELGRRLEATPVDSALVVPLTGATGERGLLGIGRRPGRAAFDAAEVGMATMFAGQVALALDLADSLAHRDQSALIEERDRIARDLHDHVIQRLFAVGLTMQYIGTDPGVDSATLMERVRASVEEIDDTIKQIRTTIYRLRGPIVSPDASLRTQTTRLLDDLESVLGFRPDLTIDGPVDFGVDDDLIDDCIAVLREALTNVARHAAATRVAVSIVVSARGVELRVDDDGRGLGGSSRRSGLANLRKRAEHRAGTLSIESGPSGGTSVLWAVPAGPPGDTVG